MGTPDESRHIPLLAWWATEAHLGTTDARAALLAFLRTAPELVQSDVFRDTLAERLGKRLAHGGTEAPLADAARLLALCPPDAADQFLNGILSRLDSGDLPPMPASLREAIERRLAIEGSAPIAIGALRDGDKPSIASALKELSDKRTPIRRRNEIADALTSVRRPEAIEPLIKLLTSPTTEVFSVPQGTGALDVAIKSANDIMQARRNAELERKKLEAQMLGAQDPAFQLGSRQILIDKAGRRLEKDGKKGFAQP
jgi:hypothetical protein